MIIINYKNNIYKIEKELYETDENAYIRAWFIIKNYDEYKYDELVSRSIMYINEKNNLMKY